MKKMFLVIAIAVGIISCSTIKQVTYRPVTEWKKYEPQNTADTLGQYVIVKGILYRRDVVIVYKN